MKDIDRITGVLQTVLLGSPDAEIPSSPEPIPESMLRLNLDQLTLYERNPRIQPNQDYYMLQGTPSPHRLHILVECWHENVKVLQRAYRSDYVCCG